MKSQNYLNIRLKAFQKKLKKMDSHAALIENPVDLLYLTGLLLSAGKLFITATAARLFVDGRYLEKAAKQSPIKTLLSEEAAIEAFLKTQKIKTLSFDSKSTNYDRFLHLQLQLKKQKIQLSPIADQLKDLRLIKDAEELKMMRLSARLLWKGFKHIQKILKPGMTEREVARQFEAYVGSLGAEGNAFEPIIAFGPNTSMPHHRAGDKKLKAGEPVLVDIGVVYKNYRSDMTRMISPKRPSALFKKYYHIVREAQQAALNLCYPGMPIQALDNAAREVMARQGVEEHFLHSLGHGIGLETHEFPRISHAGEDKDTLLKPGMVITIEPGLYLPGQFGIRYEDTIAITKQGYENFYPSDEV
jgi:Xaa-Pro aminopeptidase